MQGCNMTNEEICENDRAKECDSNPDVVILACSTPLRFAKPSLYIPRLLLCRPALFQLAVYIQESLVVLSPFTTVVCLWTVLDMR